MSTDELERARSLIFAAKEEAAKDLLVPLGEGIEDGERDDLLMEIFALLGELYLVRTAYDGTEECIRRIDESLAIISVDPGGHEPRSRCAGDDVGRRDRPHAVPIHAPGPVPANRARGRRPRRPRRRRTGAVRPARRRLRVRHFPIWPTSIGSSSPTRRSCVPARLCDDDLHVQSVPLWEKVIEAIDRPGDGRESDDHLLVQGATGYGRFCIETGKLSEAEPWLRRAGARAEARGWELAKARTQLERGTASWASGDVWQTQTLVHEAYPAIAEGNRAHDVSRSWLYLGLIAMSLDKLDDADERFGYAERHWREVEKPLHIHRILLQRSWVDILNNQFDAATEKAAQARELLDSWPRHSWLQYARLDDHIGGILRAQALADPGNAAGKLEQAAELRVPAALAVDSVRHAIVDADARMRWATLVSARILAGAFAVAYEWGNVDLLSELVEYHCARGAFSTEPGDSVADDWMGSATAAVPVEAEDEYALVAAGSPSASLTGGLTRLGPMPPLRMDPDLPPILSRYRELAQQRYGRDITSDEVAWSTWP